MMNWTLVWLAAGLAVTSALHLTIGNSILEKVDELEIVTTRTLEDPYLNNLDDEAPEVVPVSSEETTEVISSIQADDDADNEPHPSIEEHPSNEEHPSVEEQPPPRPPSQESPSGEESASRSAESDSSARNSNEDDALIPAVPENSNEDTSLEDHLIVHTTSGSIQGHPWESNENIISYIDIPYGAFEKAFSSPTAAERLETIHDVKDHNKRCPQLDGGDYVGDTDCLTLSIFKPVDAENAPVLFHIHDGNFSKGSGNPSIYGPEYIVPKGVILVLPNYRLGPLGFLCLRNSTAQGNAGLKDLTLALNWLKENVILFGGNPENIVASGDGVSGALAGYLALSPKSKDYINKVIIESGSVLSHWALDRSPIVTATELALNIRIFDALEDTDASVLINGAKDTAFRPCVEESADGFLTETPWKMMQEEGITKHFLIGSAKYAGIHETLSQTEESVEQLNTKSSLLLPDDLEFETDHEKSQIAARVKAQYFGDRAITLSDIEDLTLCFTDATYLGPGIRSARLLVESGATVFLYEFAFAGALNRELEALLRPVTGAVLGDIKGYLFTQDGMTPEADTDEHHMVEVLTELWTSFMLTGTPTADDIDWKKLEHTTEAEEEWLSIEKESTMKTGLYVDRLNLWTEIYDNHYVERNNAHGISPYVFSILGIQILLYLVFCSNASHLF